VALGLAWYYLNGQLNGINLLPFVLHRRCQRRVVESEKPRAPAFRSTKVCEVPAFIGEIAAFPSRYPGPALAPVAVVVSLTSITFLIGPLARHAEAHKDARPSKADGLRAWRRGNYEAAMHVLWPYAEDGDAAAQNAIGEILISGKLTSRTWAPRDGAEATVWFRKAAFQGFPRAQVNLGFMLEKTGRIAAKKEAARWYRCAAEQGFAPGQHHLARHYETGDGLPRDLGRAVFWYVKAMNQNYAASQYAFGRLRRDGIGLTRNPAEAMRLFRQAASQGLEEAREALEKMFGTEYVARSKRQSFDRR
jgi:TPR repeat protein